MQDGLNAVLQDNPAVLETYQNKFKAGGKGSLSSGSGGPGMASSTLGSAAPTASVANLVIVSALQEHARKIHTIESAADFKAVKKNLMTALVPFRELILAAKKRCEAISTRKKSLGTVAKQQAKVNTPTQSTVPSMICVLSYLSCSHDFL